jgi:hypothetical protein
LTIYLIEAGWTNADVRALTFRQLDLFFERTRARAKWIADEMKKRK